jgi:thioredoxin-related protein
VGEKPTFFLNIFLFSFQSPPNWWAFFVHILKGGFMEQIKNILIIIIVFLSVFIGYTWIQSNSDIMSQPNWRWSDEWNSDQIVPPPNADPPKQPQELPERPDGPSQPLVAKSISEAVSMSQQSNKSILVVFYADWCGPCQQLKRTTLSDPAIKEVIADHYVYVRVNADHSTSDVRKYRVTGLPTMMILDSNGEVLDQKRGLTGKDEMGDWLASKVLNR